MQPNVIESLRERKGKKYPAHQIARKKILEDQKSTPHPSKVKWSAPYYIHFEIAQFGRPDIGFWSVSTFH